MIQHKIKMYAFVLIAILSLAILGIFLYTWSQLHSSLAVHITPNKELIAKFPLPYEKRSFKTSDGVRIASWYLPVKDSKGVVILVHGYSSKDGGKAFMLPHAKYLRDANYSTLLVDLRSAGDSDGNKVTLGVTEWKDLVAAYDYLKTLPENDGKKIGFFGISMGAVTAINEVGESGKGDFVIASVPFSSFDSLYSWQIAKRGLPVPIFLPFLKIAAIIELGPGYEHFSAGNLIKKVKVPVLIIQAKKDQSLNPKDPKTIYDLASLPKEIWQVDSDHDVYDEKPGEFKEKVLKFLNGL